MSSARFATGPHSGLTAVTVRGFKSLSARTRLTFGPLTVLAGANSSGKSSIMQPLLLLKQTLEAPYDPGRLLLDGPNARFTEASQILSRSRLRKASEFSVEVEFEGAKRVSLRFTAGPGGGLAASRLDDYSNPDSPIRLSPGMSSVRVAKRVPAFVRQVAQLIKPSNRQSVRWHVASRRGLLGPAFSVVATGSSGTERFTDASRLVQNLAGSLMELPGVLTLQRELRRLIHVPGLRGNPERSYRTAATDREFPGTFDPYVAGVLLSWRDRDPQMLLRLGAQLRRLGLAGSIGVREIDATRAEITVSRRPRAPAGDPEDMVSIADVGFGVSQTLPVLVALLAAGRGQLVYVEQPELHLHPLAQYGLARVLLRAARRGVRVVVETHSALLLLGIQTLMAQGGFTPDLVRLHWFARQASGTTRVSSARLDEAGTFGEWPVDFGVVELRAEHQFLTASERRMRREE